MSRNPHIHNNELFSLVTPGIYSQGSSRGNRHEPDLNPQPSDLKHRHITITPSG